MPRRRRQPDGVERRLHPLPAFLHRLVGQPHGQETGSAAGDLHLNVDAARLKPEERDNAHMRDQMKSFMHRNYGDPKVTLGTETARLKSGVSCGVINILLLP